MTPAVIVCGLVFVGSVLISLRLAKFIKDCDDREAARFAHPSGSVVAEAERIVHAAYTSDPTTWP